MAISFSNFSPKIQKSGIFGPKFEDFYFFAPNSEIRLIRGRCLQIWQKLSYLICHMVFRNCCPKHPNKAFLVPNLRILIFERNFAIRQIGRR